MSEDARPLDLTRRLDAWLRQWPDAKQYRVFLGVSGGFAERAPDTAEFKAAAIRVERLADHGHAPDRHPAHA